MLHRRVELENSPSMKGKQAACKVIVVLVCWRARKLPCLMDGVIFVAYNPHAWGKVFALLQRRKGAGLEAPGAGADLRRLPDFVCQSLQPLVSLIHFSHAPTALFGPE